MWASRRLADFTGPRTDWGCKGCSGNMPLFCVPAPKSVSEAWQYTYALASYLIGTFEKRLGY